MMTEYSGVHSDLDLINVANTDDYGYYFICSSWQSSNPDVINPETGKVTRPEKDTLVKLYVKHIILSRSLTMAASFLMAVRSVITKHISLCMLW